MRTDDIAYDKADFDETNEDRRDANEIDELKFESDSKRRRTSGGLFLSGAAVHGAHWLDVYGDDEDVHHPAYSDCPNSI